MKIYNMTPHEIKIVDPASTTFNADIRKNVCTGEPVVLASIPSDGVLSAKIETVADGDIGGIPVFVKRITGCDPLPCDPLPDDGDQSIFVVSALYASAYRAMYGNVDELSALYTIADPVYTPDGKTIIGCLGVCEAYFVKTDEYGYRLG